MKGRLLRYIVQMFSNPDVFTTGVHKMQHFEKSRINMNDIEKTRPHKILLKTAPIKFYKISCYYYY